MYDGKEWTTIMSGLRQRDMFDAIARLGSEYDMDCSSLSYEVLQDKIVYRESFD